MKKSMLILAAAAALSTMAAEIAVTPLKANSFKNPAVQESTVSGISAPGCSVDFPQQGAIDGTGVNQVKLVVGSLPGGAEMLASDYQINLRKDNKVQTDAYGAPGRNPGEIYFTLANVPAEINLIRLYPDKRRRFLGKELKLNFKSLTFDKAENGAYFVEVQNARPGNCGTSGKFPVFTVKPQNVGSSIIINVPKNLSSAKFSKIELGLTMLKGELNPAAMEANPRTADNKVQCSVFKPQVEGNKYTFTLKEPFTNASVVVFYINRDQKLTGKELSYRVDYLCLIP